MRFQNGQNIDLATSILINSAGTILTGLGDVTVRVRRESNGHWLDWNDNTFKAAGWTTLDGAMVEVDATRAAGVYGRDFPTTGFADDRYYFRMQSPTAFNGLQEAAALVGEWADNLDAAISTRATVAAILDENIVAGHTTADSLALLLRELWQIHGLDDAKPLEVNSATPAGTRRVPVGGATINQSVAVAGSVATVSRI